MVRILVAEPSYLVRKGLVTILNELKVQTKAEEISNVDDLQEALHTTMPHILLINTSISSLPQAQRILEKNSAAVHIINVYNTVLNNEGRHQAISIFDSKVLLMNELRKQIKHIQKPDSHHDSSDELTEREIDVLKKVALGKTNKEVANELFISTHTVISHRKNITRKLGIKTVSGLTVYAILNQFIKLEDI